MLAANRVSAPVSALADMLYVEDVFSTHLYQGTGSAQSIATGVPLADSPVTKAFSAFAYRGNASARSITSGINLADGGMVWFKQRNQGATGWNHVLVDSVRGIRSGLSSNTTGAANTYNADTITAFNVDGFSLGADTASHLFNGSASTDYIAWCFAKKAKFMDIVTWTGNGGSQSIPHATGSAGMVFIKRTDVASDWVVWHRSLSSSNYIVLNTTAAQTNSGGASRFGNGIIYTAPNAATITVGNHADVNASGGQYVAYVFAHDTATDGMIQCGTYNGSGTASTRTVTLGWKPQWLLIKRMTGGVGSWHIIDATRGEAAGASGNDAVLSPNSSAAETSSIVVDFEATGFRLQGTSAEFNAASTAYIYMAIRAPEVSSDGGGMVWTKARTGTVSHHLHDTVRGASASLSTNLTDPQYTNYPLNSFSGNGFNLGASFHNTASTPYASWTFRQAKKFFTICQWQGNGVAGRQIPHDLGVAPGMIVVKSTSLSGTDWKVYHRNLASGHVLNLNAPTASTSEPNNFGDGSVGIAPTSSVFTVGGSGNTNAASYTYVAYLFAHDDSEDGLIQCGSFTTDASGNASVTLGWEPQWILVKKSNGTSSWGIQDVARGWPVGGNVQALYPNSSAAETTDVSMGDLTATGLNAKNGGASATWVYVAIRRGPMRPPTSGTQVYQAIARTGTGAAATVTGVGFPPDLMFSKSRNTADANGTFDRLRGAGKRLVTSSTNAEASDSDSVTAFGMDGVTLGADSSYSVNKPYNYIHHFLRRYPQVFDEVCYQGTGVARTVAHNLQVPPELVIIKARGADTGQTNGYWPVYSSALNKTGFLNDTGAFSGTGITDLTATTFGQIMFGSARYGNTSGVAFIALLFASLPGISKVSNFTGSASDVTVDCGFTAGARFILAKRTDSTGDWICVDTVRGIAVGADKSLALNTTAAEFTTNDIVNPTAVGFIAKAGGALNPAAGASMIYLAFA